MTKSTKIIAALGVAAGLGIAALPAGAIFADDLIPFDYTAPTTTAADKDVTVKLTVTDSIAIAVEKSECVAKVGAADFQVKTLGTCEEKVAGGTNNIYGFTLNVKDADSDTSLKRSGSTTANGQIEAVDGNLGGTTWVAGWNLTGGALDKAAITDSNQKVMKTNNAHDAQVNMVYTIATKPNQEVGTYEDVITYSIVANQTAVTEGAVDGDTTVGGQND